MIETRLISYFLAIAREQSITKAANMLHITQPTLSKQMMDLEQELGCQLFIRGKKKITLTEEGQYFRRRGQEMMELMAATEATLHTSEQHIRGEITFGCGETTQMAYIASRFAGLHALYPDIHLNLYSGNSEAILERMDKGLVDVGLLLNPSGSDQHEFIDLNRADRFGLLMRPDADLAEKEFVTLEDLKTIPLLVSAQIFSQHERSIIPVNESDLNIVSRYNLIYNASHLTEQGLGYALTLEGLLDTSQRALTFRPLEPEILAPWKLVTKKFQPQSAAVKVFLELFRESSL